MPKRVQLLLLYPQNSFCHVVPAEQQQTLHDGELCVPGAWEDMERVAGLIERLGKTLYDIHVALESRHWLHISHPIWFHDKFGKQPEPFTVMRLQSGSIVGSREDREGVTCDVGEYKTSCPYLTKRTVEYLRRLEERGRYVHRIWPTHCITGTPGHCIVRPLMESLRGWCQDNLVPTNFHTTGGNIFTEYHSALQAAVPDPDDRATELYYPLAEMLKQFDEILLAGEPACRLANTVIDLANEMGDEAFVTRSVLLTDGTSPMPGFEVQHERFVETMAARGMRTATCAEYCA